MKKMVLTIVFCFSNVTMASSIPNIEMVSADARKSSKSKISYDVDGTALNGAYVFRYHVSLEKVSEECVFVSSVFNKEGYFKN